MKELNGIFLEKGLFVSIKGQLSLTKWHLGDQEGQVEIEYSPHRKLFLTLLIQIKKSFFQKGDCSTNCPIPGCFIFLK